jgi:hypothetical protein
MKKYSLLSLIALSSLFFSCEKEDDITSWDIPIDSENPVIDVKVDDFSINFYLLNEDGVKTNKFNEGENFYLHFSIKNVSENEYYFVPRFASESYVNTFFNVFKATGEDLGKSIESIMTNTIGLAGYTFDPNEEVIYEFPWLFHSETSWEYKWTHYRSKTRLPLEKGQYYTGFDSEFIFHPRGDNENEKKYDLTFKINFEIN